MKKWILIVEDEKDLVELVSEELTAEGFSVISCSKVVDAMRYLGNQKFDCVLLDMRLEGGTGSQIIVTIREDKENLNYSTPILVVSGQLNVDIVVKIRNSVSGVFVKPFDLRTLIKKVRTLCT